eukprot:5406491-Pyramimonas_sp.AAC.1
MLMQLFHCVVTPAALYGSGSWVMTVERERRTVTTDGELETWVNWVKRVTLATRQTMNNMDLPGWVDERRSRLRN